MTRATAKATAKKSTRTVRRLTGQTVTAEDERIATQGPVQYGQIPVTPRTEEAAVLRRQLEMLRWRPDGLELAGAWLFLVIDVLGHDWARRLFLLNLRHEPASDEDVAREILPSRPVDDVKRIMAALSEIGMIEEAQEPDWADREEEGKRRTRTAKKRATQTKKTGQKKATVRTRPDKSGQVQTPSRTKSEIEENRRGRKEKRNRIEGEAGLKATGRDTHQEDHPAPTATPSMSSAKSDDGAGPCSRGREARPTSIPTLGHVVKLSRYRYDPAAWAFADGVLLASGYRAANGADRECERAHWAKAWDDAAAEFSPEVCERLKRRIIEAAAGIHGRRGDYRNPEAYLLTAWQNDVKDARRQRCARGAG